MTGTPVEGSKLWMYCNVTNGTGPIQYVWQHETQNKNITNLNQNNSVVHVDEVNRNYTGWYRCVVSNAVNNESSDQVWLDIKCMYLQIMSDNRMTTLHLGLSLEMWAMCFGFNHIHIFLVFICPCSVF